MLIRPYIIIPNLIEQPTWGGKYIAKAKKIKEKSLTNINIGQSYELYEHTNFSAKPSTETGASVELGNPSEPYKAKLISNHDKPINIKKMIELHDKEVLGKKTLKIYGPKMGVLVKFTQALGNSYQIHVKKLIKNVNWLPKPESWYYFEPGYITLGIKKGADWSKFQNTCLKINAKAIELSQKVKIGQLTIIQARQELGKLIDLLSPEQYVNTIPVKKDQAIDLSACGIHHSWEEDNRLAPNGNIVYEVQENVYDPDSTVRCFDKGKIKDDGSIRTIHIDDYFNFIDRSEKANDPKTHYSQKKTIFSDRGIKAQQIFENPKYSMQEISIKIPLKNPLTITKGTFHHIFVRQGNIKLISKSDSLIITQGFSAFIPASTGLYEIIPYKSSKSVILKTYV